MARIVVVSADPVTRAEVVAALDKRHDIRAMGPTWTQPGAPTLRRTLRGVAPDLVVIDSDLLLRPNVASEVRSCGKATTRRVRPSRSSIEPLPPALIVLVDPGQERTLLSCFDAGADDYSVRPVDARDLAERVERALAERAAQVLPGGAVHAISISDDGRILSAATGKEEEPDEIQARLGRYHVSGVLGRGGYGVVYRARDAALGREVALKVLPRDMHDNSEAVTRFLRESTAIARLDHPNIVRFHEMGSYKGRLFFTMELVEGTTLKAIAEREAPLSLRRASRYVAEIARALQAMDSIGLVHRDVKPENVLITADDRLKLIDFGLVRIRDTAGITSQDDVLGTPYFMAPEYIKAPGIPDIRYDLYALGVTWFHLLTGEYPFDGKNAAHVMEKHLRCPIPKVTHFQPGVPPLAERIIERLLQKEPEQRVQSPQELLTLMAPLLDAGRPVRVAG